MTTPATPADTSPPNLNPAQVAQLLADMETMRAQLASLGSTSTATEPRFAHVFDLLRELARACLGADTLNEFNIKVQQLEDEAYPPEVDDAPPAAAAPAAVDVSTMTDIERAARRAQLEAELVALG